MNTQQVISVANYAGLVAGFSTPGYMADQIVTIADPTYGGDGVIINEPGHGFTNNRGMRVRLDNDNYWKRISAKVYIEYFEASPEKSAFHNTGSIQEAINYASNNGVDTVFAGDGKFQLNTIYFYYDAGLNPGFNQDRKGRIGLEGAGNLTISELRGFTSNEYGTIFDFQNTTGQCFYVSDNDDPASMQFPQRRVRLKGFTVINNSTNGYGIFIKSCPLGQVEDVSIQVTTATGSGMRFTSAWFGTVKRLLAIGRGANSQLSSVGLEVGSSIFGGLFKVEDSVIDSFYVNVSDPTDSVLFSPMVFENTAFQNAESVSILLNSAIDLTFEQCYHEKNKGSYIRMDNPGATLTINGGFFLGGGTGVPDSNGVKIEGFTDQPLVDLVNVRLYSVKHVRVMRPWQTFLKVTETGGNNMQGNASHIVFTAGDNAANLSGSIVMFEVAGSATLPDRTYMSTTGFGNPNISLI